MTRQGRTTGLFSMLGSIGRNVKRLTFATALLFISQESYYTVQAEEAQYLLKIHKTFIKEVIDKNFPIILEQI